MTTVATAQFNLYLITNFLSSRICDEIIAELARAPEAAAPVYGLSQQGSVDERVRKVTQLMPSVETIQHVKQRLSETQEEVASHFGIALYSYEEPQFLRYRVGDFFVAHQDGNTGLLLSDREQSRKISLVIFLNNQAEIPQADTYVGGSLTFSEWRPGRTQGQYQLTGKAGTLVAFPAETTHEVTPVMWGERYSIVSWYTSAVKGVLDG